MGEVKIAPHQHRWMVQDVNGKIEVLANSSCDICGLTPEAVANEATIKTLLAEVERLQVKNERLLGALNEARRQRGFPEIDADGNDI